MDNALAQIRRRTVSELVIKINQLFDKAPPHTGAKDWVEIELEIRRFSFF